MDLRPTNSVEDLFLHLVDLSAEERSLALANLKSENPELAELIADLLAADESNLDGLLGDKDFDDEEVPRKIGQYEIRRLVGSGGMGSVYEALHPGTGRRCAIKLLHPGFATRQNLQRFYREAEFLGRLDHPGIARVYDAGSGEAVYPSGDRSHRPYIAMEFITGVDVLTYVRTANCTLAECAALVASAAQALHHAHECGVIHRDIKPANILVDEHGAVKIVDFGIARLSETHDMTTGLTPGTVAYMSPEQMAGLRDRIDTRTDVYALGATLYALVTGSHPALGMAASNFDTVWRTGKRDSRLDAILRKAMAWAPENRYSSAAQLADDLRGWAAGKPILARPDRLDWLRRLRRSHPRTLYAAAAVGLIAGAVATQPGWRLYLRARLFPAPTHTIALLNFTTSADPTATSALPAQLSRWATKDLQAGGLLKPMPSAAGPTSDLPQGSSTLLSHREVLKLQKFGAQYALVGDYDLSGDQPWSTLKIQARLINTAEEKTEEVVSVQGSLAEAEALIADVCLQLTQSAGKREQFLRLQSTRHPDNDRLYDEGVELFAKRDLIKARTVFEDVLNHDYSNTRARLALARIIDALGYRDLAQKQAALSADFAANDLQRTDAQALQIELEGRLDEGLRKRDTMALPSGQPDSWIQQDSYITDLLASNQLDRAAALIAAGSAAPGITEAERLHWLLLRTAYLRIVKGRPGQKETAENLAGTARREGDKTMLADSLIVLAEALTFAGEQEKSIAALEEARDIYSSEGDREGRARAMLTIGQRMQIHGRTGDAIAILSDAMREVTGAGFAGTELKIAQLLGQAYNRGYDPELSRQMLSRALVLSWNEPDKYATRQVLLRLGITATDAGNLAEGRRLLQSALPPENERGEVAGRTFNALGETALLAGDTKSALDDAAQATALGVGVEDVETDAMALRARARALEGDYSTVEPVFRKVVEIADRRGMSGSVANGQLDWGECLLQGGSARAAVPHLRTAENLFLQIDRPAYQGEADAVLATALIKLGDISGARASLARAGAIGSLNKFAKPRILFGLAEAQLAAAQGDRAAAKQLYKSVEDDASHLGFAPQAQAAEAALRQLDRPRS
jgi:serine/threonine protein kinase